jgi:hypothetical protein
MQCSICNWNLGNEGLMATMAFLAETTWGASAHNRHLVCYTDIKKANPSAFIACKGSPFLYFVEWV